MNFGPDDIMISVFFDEGGYLRPLELYDVKLSVGAEQRNIELV